MNTWSISIIVATILPALIVAFFALLQIYGDKSRMKKLWEAHDKIAGATDDERKQKQDLRQSMHTLKLTGSANGADVFRHLVAFTLVGTQVAIVIWLSGQTTATPSFYALVGFLAASLALVGLFLSGRSQEF